MLNDGIEVRHLDGVKANYSIVDKTDCVLYSVQAEGQEPMQIIVTNTKSFVEQQQLFFDNLWSNAIPAEKRIKELEGQLRVADEFTEIVTDRLKIENICKDLKSSTEEIPLIFPPPEFIVLLIELLQKKSINVKVRNLASPDKIRLLAKCSKNMA